MLEFTFDIIDLLTGFWRFVFSRRFREKTINRWRDDRVSFGGGIYIFAEISISTLVGVGVPLFLIVFLVLNFPGD